MSERGYRGARRDDAAHEDENATAGKRGLVEERYPALGAAMARRAGGEQTPSIHDAATVAVEGKDTGAPVDGEVAAKVGAHLGADFSSTRVHQDPLAQQATAAMGARAFAHGGDVFLGPGESGADLGLMAHELTHVAQQGAAGQRLPQRAAIQVGDANSPAEHEAEGVAAAVTGGRARPAGLIVDDGPLQPGQMLRSQFFEQLRADVSAACSEELGPEFAVIGVPFVDQTFDRYRALPSAGAEATIKRTTPGADSVQAAAELIPLVVARMRAAVRVWRDTGQTPPDFAAVAPGAAAAAGPAAARTAQALRAPDGAETLASLEAELGPGTRLDGATASRMSSALGADVSAARIHTGPIAARKAAEAGALAYTVGDNVVMGSAAPAAGTLEGDALLAHELAHVGQQHDAAGDPAARMAPLGSESGAAEEHADQAAAVAVSEQQGKKGLLARMSSALSTGLRLQRCENAQQRAHAKLVQLNTAHGNGDVVFRAAVNALTAAETRLLLDNISPADQVTYAALITAIKNERVINNAEQLVGHLDWSGPSGPDNTGQIDTGSQIGRGPNAFAVWIRGGADPNDASGMNCWEMVLYSAWRSGAVSKAWLVQIHTDATQANNALNAAPTAYHDVIAARLNYGGAAPIQNNVAIPRGNIVFMSGVNHVAISTGVLDRNGHHEVISLWQVPNNNYATQRTTVEALDDEADRGGLGRQVLRHAPAPW